ncbi:MAG: GGDEF domain-containing protein [Candidatus Polarisedimenticolaceae bacterium]|nr:GGDEF domain-containing protein [Candidatus Polarisedimenticolaceae bacterium]
MNKQDSFQSNHHTLSGLELAIEMTAQRDHMSLTALFLGQLQTIIPGMLVARVFEVHCADGCKDYSGVPTDKLIVRELMNDMESPKPFTDFADLNHCIQNASSGQEGTKQHQQIMLPIPGANGQMRVLLLEAELIDPDNWVIIHNLLSIYSNLLLTLDEKERDQLTGLLNRQTFDHKLTQIISYYRKQALQEGRGKGSSWLAILDIDHFKKVNDEHGHLIGDEVLLVFSRLMEKSFRCTDLLFRYGGEEFVVILNCCDGKGAACALERFRHTVEQHFFPQIGRLTASTGYVCLQDNMLPSTLIDQADQALYYAKDHGRNQVVSYETISKQTDAPAAIENGGIELF